MNTLGLKIKSRPKMDMGKEEHEKEHRRVKDRKTVYGFSEEEISKVIHDLMIEDPKLGIYGIIDTTVILKNGEIIPIDVKYSSATSVRINWKKQLIAYSLLLESHFGTVVKRAMIYLPAQHKQMEIDINNESKEIVKQDIRKIEELIESEKMPNVLKGNQCSYCEMNKFCF